MSGVFTSSIWNKSNMKKRIWVDVVGFAILFVISVTMLICLDIDPKGSSIFQWVNFFVTIAVFYCLIIALCLIGLNLKGRQFIPLVLFLIFTGHVLAVFMLLFFAVKIPGISVGLGGGVTLGLFGLIFLIALRDLLGDFRELKFWKEFTPELKNLIDSKSLNTKWRIVTFFWQPKLIVEKEKNPIRDFFEGILMAFILALIIRTHSLEAYEIPTGSMKPTLWGISNGTNGSDHQKIQIRDGDRILVNKFVYGLREPKRWDVIVFKYPLNSMKNFIKRLIGMPDEQLLIHKGDIWSRPAKNGIPDKNADFKIVKKTEDAQNALWSLFYSYIYENAINNTGEGCKCDIYPLKLGVSIENDWTPTFLPNGNDDYKPNLRTSTAYNRPFLDWDYNENSSWKTVGTGKEVAFRADVKNKKPAVLGFTKYFNDRFTLPRDNAEYKTFEFKDKQQFENNEPSSAQDFAPVADIRYKSVWKFDDEKGQAKIQYHRGFREIMGDADMRIEFTFGPNKCELQAIIQKDLGGEQIQKPEQDILQLLKEHDVVINPNTEFTVDLAVVDGDVILKINNRNILRWSIQLPIYPSRDVEDLDSNDEISELTFFRIIMENGAGEFKHPEFWRDVYYRGDGECDPAIVIPAKNYFAMGDNCKNSKDSRLWYKGVFTLVNSSPILEENFENGAKPENWEYNGDWEWGKPNFAFGPRKDNTSDGTKCFGTGMNDNYSSNRTFSDCSLVSPVFNLENTKHPKLLFYQWYDFDPNDGGKIQISKDKGKSWNDLKTSITPPYEQDSKGNSLFLGYSNWDLVIADLSDYAGEKQIQIRWALQSNESAQNKGWFIDDVVVLDTKEIVTEMDPNSDSKSSVISILRTSRSEIRTNDVKLFEDDLKELKRSQKSIFIEDVFGVVKKFDTAKIISFDVKPASFVPDKNMLGRAMIRFWPLKFLKFIK